MFPMTIWIDRLCPWGDELHWRLNATHFTVRSCILKHLHIEYPTCMNADVSLATGVAEGTIRNSFKDLYPHLSKIIPNWYAQGQDLRNLSSPWWAKLTMSTSDNFFRKWLQECCVSEGPSMKLTGGEASFTSTCGLIHITLSNREDLG